MTGKFTHSDHLELLKAGPSAAEAALSAWLSADRIDRKINWLGFSEVVGRKAVTSARHGFRKDALAWADIKIRVNELILSKIDPHHIEKYQVASMMMRLSMLRAYGPKSGHPILDPKIIEAWALSFPNISLEEASSYKDYQKLRPALRKRLGKTYYRLKVLALLYNIIDHEPSSEVRNALLLWEVLKQ